MLFSVIYSVDCDEEESIAQFAPPHVRSRIKGERVWEMTERSDAPDDAEIEGMSKHRKWCAILTLAQFREFVEHCGLEAEDVETMGSLGAPGCGMGCSPAISFNGSGDAYQNAYVTPILDKLCALREKKGKESIGTEEDWARIRAAMMRAFGDWRARERYELAG